MKKFNFNDVKLLGLFLCEIGAKIMSDWNFVLPFSYNFKSLGES